MVGVCICRMALSFACANRLSICQPTRNTAYTSAKCDVWNCNSPDLPNACNPMSGKLFMKFYRICMVYFAKKTFHDLLANNKQKYKLLHRAYFIVIDSKYQSARLVSRSGIINKWGAWKQCWYAIILCNQLNSWNDWVIKCININTSLCRRGQEWQNQSTYHISILEIHTLILLSDKCGCNLRLRRHLMHYTFIVIRAVPLLKLLHKWYV